jgi:hypothetical protein
MDPVGAGLVMNSYLDFLHIGFLGFAAKALGVTFALAETVVGTALITGIWRKPIAIIAMSLQGFLTLLTIILAIFNPTMDCGCFGEAIHLTHLQTLYKNLILCALLLFAFVPMRDLGKPKKLKFVSFGLVCTSVIAFMIYSLLYLPMIDFTEFKPGAGLAAIKADTEFSNESAFESVFVYEKDGVQQEFTLDNLPDSTWTFVSTQTTQHSDLSNSGATLSFYDADNEYHDHLAVEGNVMIVSIYDPEIDKDEWEESIQFAKEALNVGFKPMILIAGTPDQVENIPTEDIPVYFCDYKTLITMNRSNAGATWISQSHFIKKWAAGAYPDLNQMEQYLKNDATEAVLENDTEGSLIFQGFMLYVFAVMLLL